jgi:hypothetical protein
MYGFTYSVSNIVFFVQMSMPSLIPPALLTECSVHVYFIFVEMFMRVQFLLLGIVRLENYAWRVKPVKLNIISLK